MLDVSPCDMSVGAQTWHWDKNGISGAQIESAMTDPERVEVNWHTCVAVLIRTLRLSVGDFGFQVLNPLQCVLDTFFKMISTRASNMHFFDLGKYWEVLGVWAGGFWEVWVGIWGYA